MAARSFFISVRNYTGRPWKRQGLGLSHGEWSNNQKSIPPENISKLTLDRDGDAIPGTISFESESGGFATGTEGFVDYIDDKGEKLHIDWDNPFIGSNSFHINLPKGYKASYGDISGNHANVNVDIRKEG